MFAPISSCPLKKVICNSVFSLTDISFALWVDKKLRVLLLIKSAALTRALSPIGLLSLVPPLKLEKLETPALTGSKP